MQTCTRSTDGRSDGARADWPAAEGDRAWAKCRGMPQQDTRRNERTISSQSDPKCSLSPRPPNGTASCAFPHATLAHSATTAATHSSLQASTFSDSSSPLAKLPSTYAGATFRTSAASANFNPLQVVVLEEYGDVGQQVHVASLCRVWHLHFHVGLAAVVKHAESRKASRSLVGRYCVRPASGRSESVVACGLRGTFTSF